MVPVSNKKFKVSFIPRFSVFMAALVLAITIGAAKAGETRSFSFDIHNGHVAKAKRTIKVTEGDRVELNWKTDKAAELHLHGYDITLNVSPGRPGAMTFEAHTAGRFPVGLHGGGGHGKIIYLEVHPR